MDLLKVRVENFRCFQGTHELDMSEGPLWVVRGENGSGKSTLVCDSILFTLFNTIPSLEGTQSLKKTDLINLHHKVMSVQIWFNHNGNYYSIKRSYQVKGKSDTLHHLFIAWQNKKEIINTAKQDEARIFVNEKFWEIEDFRNTTIVLQNEITKSIEQRESERKKSIEKIFSIERFERMSELAHKHSRDASADIKIVTNSLEDIKKHIVNEQELEEKKFNTLESLKVTNTQKDELEKELKKKKSIKEKLDKAVLQGDSLKERIQQKKSDLTHNEKEKQTHEEELKTINSDLEKEPEYLKRLENIEQLEKFLEGASKILEKITNKEQEKDSYQKLVMKKEQDLQTELKQLENTKSLVEKQFDSTKNELTNLEKIETAIPQLSEVVKTLPGLTKTKETLSKELEESELLEKSVFEKQKSLELQKKAVQSQLLELAKKTTNLKNLEDDKKVTEEGFNNSRVIGKQLEQETEDFEELLQKEQELNSILLKINHNIDFLNKSINEVQIETNEIKSLDSKGVCPKCKQKLSVIHINDIIQENDQKIQELQQKITNFNLEKSKIQKDLTSLNKILQSKKKSKIELEKVMNKYSGEKSKLEELNKQIISLKDEMKNLLEMKENFDKNVLFSSLQAELTQLKTKLPDITKLKAQKVEIDQKILEISKQESQLNELKNQLKNKPEKENLLKSFSNNIKEITEKIKLKSESLTNKEFAVEEKKVLEDIEKQLVELKKDLPNIENKKLELKTLEPEQTRLKIKSLYEQKGIRKAKLERIEAIKTSMSAIKVDLDDLTEKLNQLELERVIPDVENYRVAIENLEKQFLDINKTAMKLELELQAIAEQVTKNTQYMNEFKAKTKEYETIKNKKDDYDLLETLFKDIGKRILNRVMNRINLYSTEILGRLGNEQLEQITLSESKNGFELKIISGGEERYPNWFSGGQKVRIGLAFRLSLSKTLAEVTGGDIETILIDEGDFGALDEQGLKGVADILNDLKTFFKRMVIVTHMDNLANELDGKRLLIKDSKVLQENQI